MFASFFGVLLLSIVSGILSEALLTPVLREFVDLVFGSVRLSALILVVAYPALPWFEHMLVRAT